MSCLSISELPTAEVIDFTARLRKERVVEVLTHRANWAHTSDRAYRAGIAEAVATLAIGGSASKALLRGYRVMRNSAPEVA
jgi:hypothetical protein